MDNLTLPPLTADDPQSVLPPESDFAGRPDALVVAADPLVAHGVARLLERSGAVGAVVLHDRLDAALAGPVAPVLVVHADTPDLTLDRLANLIRRRGAVALLAAGTGPGLSSLRAAGARGVLTGVEGPALCRRMLELVLAGGSCWTAAPGVPVEPADPRDGIRRIGVHLSPRQRQVAAELARGHSNKGIAHALGIAEGTVKIHVTAVLRAFGVSGRAAAVARLARRLGPDADEDAAPEPAPRPGRGFPHRLPVRDGLAEGRGR